LQLYSQNIFLYFIKDNKATIENRSLFKIIIERYRLNDLNVSFIDQQVTFYTSLKIVL
jgi:hypothetical protein